MANISTLTVGGTKYNIKDSSGTYLPLSGGTLTGELIQQKNKIWVQGGSNAGNNTNRLTIATSGMPSDFLYNSSKRGTAIYSNGIAFADPYNGNSNNDAAWIRHIEETANTGILEIATGDDNANESVVVRRYNTSGAVGKELYLFNSSGDTTIPGSLSVVGNINTTGGLLKSTLNGNTVTIGSQNSGWCHFANSANINFHFNKSVYVEGDIYKYGSPNVKVSYEGHTHSYLPLSGGTMTGTITSSASNGFNNSVAAGTWAYTRYKSGDYFWDIAVKSNSNSGALDFRPGGVDNKGPHFDYTGRVDFANSGTTSGKNSYTDSAIQIREKGYQGAGEDTWGVAPRLAFHWNGRVAACLGLASNGYLYVSPNNHSQANFYKIMFESGTWGINITGSAGSVAWANVTGKPSSFTPASHTHYYLATIGDQRSTATTPNTYANTLQFLGLKNNSTIGSPSGDTYSYLVGLRGWSDSSGGNSHELAFNNTGIYWRNGATTSWGSWARIYTTANKPTWDDVQSKPSSFTPASHGHGVNTTNVGSASGWSAGSVPTVTAVACDDITSWSAGTVTTVTVPSGTTKLVITNGTAPSLGYTARSVNSVTNVGTAPALTVSTVTVATSVKNS